MIIIVKPEAEEERVQELLRWLEAQNLTADVSRGELATVIGVVGDTTGLDTDRVCALDIVDSVKRVTEPCRCAGRRLHPADTVVDVAGVKLGGGHFAMIAGPCSVESPEQIRSVAESAKAAGAQILRGGAFKPRSSPYVFQGLRAAGLELLRRAGQAVGLPIVTEIMDVRHLPLFEGVDLIQVGARNMQNFELLKELGRQPKPVLLKRGPASTVKELLLAAEYIMAGGHGQVVLCERGIRSFETATRNTLDLSAVPVLHELTHLPVIVDPSHAAGAARYVRPLALAAAAAGADGLIIEVHNDPPHALCDGQQALTPEEYAALAGTVRQLRRLLAGGAAAQGEGKGR